MRIVQVVPRYQPRTGGVETHVQELSERLVDRGHDVTVLTADAGNDVADRETRDGVEVRRHKGFAPSDAFHIAPGILRTLRQCEADVIHAHNYHSLPLLFAAVGARDVRFIATPHYHGGSASSFRDRLLSAYRPFGAWALRQADAVIAVSEWERDELRNDFGIDATVIPNGVDVERFQDAELRQRDTPYLLTVGRLEEYKGVQHVIRALSELPEYELLIAGRGSYRNDLEQIAAEAGVRDRVEFLGYVDDVELPGLYAGAEVYVTMSSFEAYGMTVGEALASGTPCVIRETAALGDWSNSQGCFGVETISPETVVQAVNEVVGWENSYAEALSTWGDVVTELESQYERSS